MFCVYIVTNEETMNWLIVGALCVAFLLGVAPVVHKHLLSRVHCKPSTLICVGGLANLAIVLLYSYANKKEIRADIDKHEAKTLFLIALTAVATSFVASVIYMYVLRESPSYVVSALIYSSPAFTVLIAYMFLDERISLIGLVGVMLIVAGIMCVSTASI